MTPMNRWMKKSNEKLAQKLDPHPEYIGGDLKSFGEYNFYVPKISCFSPKNLSEFYLSNQGSGFRRGKTELNHCKLYFRKVE